MLTRYHSASHLKMGAWSDTIISAGLITESGSVSLTPRMGFSSKLREDFGPASVAWLTLNPGSLTFQQNYSFPSVHLFCNIIPIYF
jgi:hypothetical protein